MNKPGSVIESVMRNGAKYRIQLCVEPDTQHTVALLKDQISDGFANMSIRSRASRFASPISRLTALQLDYLVDLDGKDRVAWCASITRDSGERGIGLGRYAKLLDEVQIAEFAITIVDEFQNQGIGYQLLVKLIESAQMNHFKVLRGYVLKSNKPMLALCRRFNAINNKNEGPFAILDILLN